MPTLDLVCLGSPLTSEILNELREQLDQRDYETAYALGTARSFDVATKVLLDHLKTLPPVGV